MSSSYTTTFAPLTSTSLRNNYSNHNTAQPINLLPPTYIAIDLSSSFAGQQTDRYLTPIGPLMHNDYTPNDPHLELLKQQYLAGCSQVSPLGPAVGIPTDSANLQQTPWSMYANSDSDTYKSMGFASVAPVNGLKRQRSHQRTPSASTVGSNGPLSPYNVNSSHPQIANTDFDPSHSQGFSKDQTIVADPAYLSAHYMPTRAAGFGHSGMRDFAGISQQFEEQPSRSSRTSMSTVEQDSPVTPGSAPGEADSKQIKNAPEFRTFNPKVQLERTESAAYQDELFNPANFYATPAVKTAKQQAPTSAQRTLVNQRLETANMARSQSPNSSASRDRSPFREGSQLAPTTGWPSPTVPMSTAASRRQQMKSEREEAEYAVHRPQLQREPTKTISPKDALLDFNETDQPSLFQDSVPIGYKQHLGSGVTDDLTNAYIGQQVPTTTFSLPPSSQTSSMAGFRASSADGFSGNFNFTPPALPTTAPLQNAYQINNFQQMSHLAPSYPATSMDPTPDFPAHLTSMESSISEGPPLSSQESGTLALQRPADTRAATGTYTCTYHGCTQRFESPQALQKHKREFHRSQQPQHHRDELSAEASSVSPRSTESPGPTSAGSSLTSAQILARNSQAGPHKCTRINPSTGKPCNTIFSRPYDLTRHEDTIHNGRKQKVRCPFCREEKTFSRNDALTRHMRVVHPDVENFGKRSRKGD